MVPLEKGKERREDKRMEEEKKERRKEGKMRVDKESDQSKFTDGYGRWWWWLAGGHGWARAWLRTLLMLKKVSLVASKCPRGSHGITVSVAWVRGKRTIRAEVLKERIKSSAGKWWLK